MQIYAHNLSFAYFHGNFKSFNHMQSQANGRTYLQNLQLVAYGSLAMPLVAFIYLYLESSIDRLEALVDERFHGWLFLCLLSVCGFAVYRVNMTFKKLKSLAATKTVFFEKLSDYKKATTVLFVGYAMVTAVFTIGFYLTNFQPFAAVFGIMLVLFSINNPTAGRIVKDLGLKDREKQIIMKGEDIS